MLRPASKIRIWIVLALMAIVAIDKTIGFNLLYLVFTDPRPAVEWQPINPSQYPNEDKRFMEGLAYYNREEFDYALSIWKKLAHERHPETLYLLGRMYDFGWGVERNVETSADFYKKSSKFDHALSITMLGISYGHLEVPLDFGFRRLGALGSSVGCAFCSLIFG